MAERHREKEEHDYAPLQNAEVARATAEKDLEAERPAVRAGLVCSKRRVENESELEEEERSKYCLVFRDLTASSIAHWYREALENSTGCRKALLLVLCPLVFVAGAVGTVVEILESVLDGGQAACIEGKACCSKVLMRILGVVVLIIIIIAVFVYAFACSKLSICVKN